MCDILNEKTTASPVFYVAWFKLMHSSGRCTADDYDNILDILKIFKIFSEHHNTELFITDGSLTSLMEAVHCGVPFVAVPSSGEQLVNVDLLVGRGLGRKVDVTKYLPWTLEGAIREILRDAR